MCPFFRNVPLKYCNAPVHYKNGHITKTDWYIMKQECIPVGCVPPIAVVVWGPRGDGLDLIPLNFPLASGPGSDRPELTLGWGPGSDPPQFPHWLWAWT